MREILLWMMSVVLLWPTIAQAQTTPEANPWYQDATWYLLFVRSFYDSDGDGIGDLQGVIEKLDYLNDGDPATTDDLGITGIWLMPINEAASYHSYDVTDYYAIDTDYGTLEDFEMLLQEAHARGIRIVMDLVVNHTSSQHPWFIAAESGDETFIDYYVFQDEDPGYRGPWGERAWYESNALDRWYYAPFWSEMPDLNHSNETVTREIYDIARFWIEEVGVDGFRLDAIKYLVETEVDGRPILEDSPENREYLRAFTDFVHSLNPDAVTIGEIFDSTAVVTRYTDEDVVDMAFEFSMAEDIIGAAVRGNKREIERQLATLIREYELEEIALFASNHDQNRVLTQLQGDLETNRVVANLLMTLPGAPFIYYGEEIGMEGAKPDELIRRPMQWDETPITGGFTSAAEPWQPLDEHFAARTVANSTDDPASLLSHYRDLIHLRNESAALRRGETLTIEATYRSVFAYIRHTEEETLLIVHNLDDRESRDYTLTLDESTVDVITGVELLHGTTDVDVAVPQIDENGGFADYVPIEAPLPPTSVYVIRLN